MNHRIIYALLSLLLVNNVIFAKEKQNITLQQLYKDNTFAIKDIEGLKSMKDGEHFTSFNENKTQIIKYSYKTGESVDTLLNIKKMENIELEEIQDYSLSNDEQKILFYTNRERIYRHSFFADYFVWNIKTNKLVALTKKDKIRIASLSPDGNNGSYIFKNNIYIKNLNTGKEKQITFDGKYNKIQNGTPDWVYEEEFGFIKAYQWSPDSKNIAYIKFDENDTPMFNMTLFQGTNPVLDKNKLYPENYTFKYPKPGETNSIVTVNVFNLEKDQTKTMKIGKDKEQYIPRIKWMKNSEKLAIMRLNRHQNKFEILLANPANGKSKVIYKDKEKEYIDENIYDSFVLLEDNKHFIIMSEKSGFNHLYLHNLKGKEITALTKGNFDVRSFYGYDDIDKIYYTAYDNSPLNTALYSVDLNGDNLQKLSQNTGQNSAKFANTFKYYINYFDNSKTPKLITLHHNSGELIRTLEDNIGVIDSLKKYNFNEKEFFSFKTSENIELNGWMIKPINFDPNEKYPVLIYQYSGPGSQSVKNSWSCDMYQYLTSQGYIIASVDGRGTGGRGEYFKKMTYLEIGKYETIDMVESAKYLQSLTYVDGDRIGIWGWSYGGYITLLCMEKGDGIFKAGVAVAPVTNWRFYDSIYTERFMRTPQENPSGYDDNSPLFFADQFQGKLLICHGSADDNVHMQNTMEYIEKLVQADKQFDMMIYTNRNHSIYGGNTKYHLRKKICDFIINNL